MADEINAALSAIVTRREWHQKQIKKLRAAEHALRKIMSTSDAARLQEAPKRGAERSTPAPRSSETVEFSLSHDIRSVMARIGAADTRTIVEAVQAKRDGAHRGSIRSLLSQWSRRGRITRSEDGKWSLPSADQQDARENDTEAPEGQTPAPLS